MLAGFSAPATCDVTRDDSDWTTISVSCPTHHILSSTSHDRGKSPNPSRPGDLHKWGARRPERRAHRERVRTNYLFILPNTYWPARADSLYSFRLSHGTALFGNPSSHKPEANESNKMLCTNARYLYFFHLSALVSPLLFLSLGAMGLKVVREVSRLEAINWKAKCNIRRQRNICVR